MPRRCIGYGYPRPRGVLRLVVKPRVGIRREKGAVVTKPEKPSIVVMVVVVVVVVAAVSMCERWRRKLSERRE